jgi:hypothetical protein
VAESFGSFTGLDRQLTEAAMNVQGSGRGALGWEPLGGRRSTSESADLVSAIPRSVDIAALWVRLEFVLQWRGRSSAAAPIAK